MSKSTSFRTILFLALAALALSACGDFDVDVSFAEEVKGSGDLTTESLDLDDFSEIRVCCDLEIEFEVDPSASMAVEVITDDNLHQYLQFDVSDGRLSIEPEDNKDLKPTAPMEIVISGRDISGLEAESSSEVSGSFSTNGRFDLTGDSDARIAVDIEAGDLKVDADSSTEISIDLIGSIDGLEIEADSDAQLNIRNVDADTVELRAHSSSEVSLEGTAREAKIGAESDAQVLLRNLTLVDATINASSSSEVEVTASGRVKGDASSDAVVEVSGGASRDFGVSSSGEVREGN